jgi:hypothetical protein
MKMIRFMCVLLPLFALSCADSGGPILVDAQWNLTCPSGGAGCGSLAPETCLGVAGQRAIVGERGQPACNGDPILAVCEAVQRADGTRNVKLEAEVGGGFAFLLSGATIDAGEGIVEQTACNVTIIEDGLPYDYGASGAFNCGTEAPSMEQPCQLSNVSVEGTDVVFDVQCDSLLSSTTGGAFNVAAVGGGPATIRFANCVGF